MARISISSLLLLIACASTPTTTPAREVIEVALTVDDLPVHGPLIDGVTRLDLAKRMLAAFERHHLPSVYGFVNGQRLEADASTEAVLREWVAHGQPLGNHGYSHANLNSTPLPQYLSDIDKNESLLTRLSPAGADWHFYRSRFCMKARTRPRAGPCARTSRSTATSSRR